MAIAKYIKPYAAWLQIFEKAYTRRLRKANFLGVDDDDDADDTSLSKTVSVVPPVVTNVTAFKVGKSKDREAGTGFALGAKP